MKLVSPRLVGLLALLGAAALLCWIWSGAGRTGALSDGLRTFVSGAPLRTVTWSEPRLSPYGSADRAERTALSPDGRWLVWAAGADGAEAARDLFVAEVAGGRAGEPQVLAALCTPADETAPAFGGEWLYFSSDRAGGAGGHDLWRARFADGSAEAPEPVPGAANTAAEELDPAPLASAEELVFASDRGGAGFDLFEVALAGGDARRVEELCSARDEREPAFTQVDRALVFASDRAGGAGGFDLYRAARFGGAYSGLEPLDALNTEADERAPAADGDALALCFVRRGAEGDASLLRATAVELFRAPPRAVHWMEWLALAGLVALALLALLVRRFPELDLLYKCLLLSVALHLGLLWWFRDVWLEVHPASGEHPREPIHVRLADPDPRDAPVPAAEPEPLALGALAAPAFAAELQPERAAAETRPAPEAPRTDSVAERARETSNRPDTAALPARAEPHLPAAEPALAAAAPAAELALPELAAARTAESAPARFELAAPRATPNPNTESVARSAEPRENAPARGADAPAPASERALALRDAAREARPAEPAPDLDLTSAQGAASPSSRSVGSPSRPALERPLGSPAARPSSGSVARAAAEPEPSARTARDAADALPSARSRSSAELEASPGGGAGSVARAAAPAAPLDLPGAGSARSGSAPSEAAGPERAEVERSAQSTARAAQPSSGSPAQKAGERGEPSAGPRAPVELEPAPSARERTSGGISGAERAEVAQRAAEARPLDLGSLGERSLGTDPRGAAPAAEPQRAQAAGPRPSAAEPSSTARGSVAARAAEPAASAPRREGDPAQAPAPARGERGVALEDGPESVAAPAGERAGERDLLTGLAPKAAEPRATREAAGAGPERAASAPPSRASEPAQQDSSSLARAPVPPAADDGPPGRSDWDSTPYQNRSGADKARALKLYGGSERTEAAVARGLAYLARIQHENGCWGDLDVVDEKYGRVAIGKTALCTLAFLGAGHTPDSGTEHSAVVGRALDFLLSVQDEASGHFGDSSAYDHGIATYAIAECYALTKDARLRAALELALAHVLAMQSRRDDDRFRGGWGYYSTDGSHYDPWPRTSITAWQVMALESARLSGLDVPDRAFDAVRGFLHHAHDSRLGAYRYNHEPERLASVYPTLPASTPAALFCLSLLGEDISGAAHAESRAYVQERAPDGYRYTGELDFVQLARGNPYFWYYGTLAMFLAGGSDWQRWNTSLQECLLPAQSRDGSWTPIDPYARYARDDASDKSYTTSLCVLSLEIYYRYYLPLLKVR